MRNAHKIRISDKSETLHKCKICGHSTGKKGSLPGLHRHYLRHHTYEHGTMCYICDQHFNTLYTLNRHLKQHAKTIILTSRRNCAYCTKVFSSPITRNKHHFLAHPEQYLALRPFHCVFCFGAFETEELKDVHYDGHLKFKCPICSLHHLGRKGYEEHMKAHAAGGRFIGKRDYSKRLAKIEKRLKEVGDPVVTGMFSVNSTEEAIRRLRLGTDNYVSCRDYARTEEMRSHLDPSIDSLELSLREKQVSTSDGPPSTSSKEVSILDQENRSRKRSIPSRGMPVSIVAPQLPFKCPKCGTQFRLGKNILTHFRRLHDVDPSGGSSTGASPSSAINVLDVETYRNPDYTADSSQPRFKCDECQMTFRLASEVIKHRKDAHGIDPIVEEYPYACDLCSLRFTCKINITN